MLVILSKFIKGIFEYSKWEWILRSAISILRVWVFVLGLQLGNHQTIVSSVIE